MPSTKIELLACMFCFPISDHVNFFLKSDTGYSLLFVNENPHQC